jgi:hypothetical protein
MRALTALLLAVSLSLVVSLPKRESFHKRAHNRAHKEAMKHAEEARERNQNHADVSKNQVHHSNRDVDNDDAFNEPMVIKTVPYKRNEGLRRSLEYNSGAPGASGVAERSSIEPSEKRSSVPASLGDQKKEDHDLTIGNFHKSASRNPFIDMEEEYVKKAPKEDLKEHFATGSVIGSVKFNKKQMPQYVVDEEDREVDPVITDVTKINRSKTIASLLPSMSHYFEEDH